jgi:apolipoprotein N-acyltransferase
MKKIHLYALAAVSGLLLSLSWPAGGFPGLIFVALIPLLFIEDHIATHPQGFHKFSPLAFAYLAFFLFNLLTTWWIKNSTLFGAIMAIVLNAFFMALTFQVYSLVKKAIFGAGRGHILLIFFWITWEFMHLDWDLSWSWLNLGNVFASRPSWVQWYSYTGAFGGTLWVLVVNILIYRIARSWRLQQGPASFYWIMIPLTLLTLALPLGVSLNTYYQYEDQGEALSVVITQPNIDPYEEQYSIPIEESVQRNLDLAARLLDEETDYIVSPESNLQENIWEHQIEQSYSIRLLRDFIADYPHLKVVIGASTFSRYEEGDVLSPTVRWHKGASFWYDAHNTAIFLEKDGPAQTYHKSVLVPGVEKMPFRKYLRFMDELAIDLGGTVGSIAPSPARKVIQPLDGSPPVGMAICYESAYGAFFSHFVRNGAEIVFIITNDGWWGETPGHRQHLQFASLRAIENRRSIARSANTGISAFINQRGDILQATPYWEPAVIKGKVYANDHLTYYSRQGDYIARASAFLAAFLLLIGITQMILKKRKSMV